MPPHTQLFKEIAIVKLSQNPRPKSEEEELGFETVLMQLLTMESSISILNLG